MATTFIRDGNIYIKVPIKSLSSGWKTTIDANMARKGYEHFRITDQRAFARDLVRTLNRENDVGDTMLTELLDRAVPKAIEEGAEGVAKVKHSTLGCFGAGNYCPCPTEDES
jgi:hypothetical protein